MIAIQNKFLIVVFRGDFNPSIFQPVWFSKNKLLSDSEVEKSQLKIVIPDISDFSTDWFSLQVTRDRFLIKTSQESHFDALGDLVSGTFSLLKHTPLRQLGINFDGNVKMKDKDSWNDYGHKLAPKEVWKKRLKNPGMNQLQMKCDRDDDYKGYILITIKPSIEIDCGVNFHINDHYENESKNELLDASFFTELFKKEKNKSIVRSTEIITSLVEET